MKVLKNIILYGALVASLGLYYHVDSQQPCKRVIPYDIGQFDEAYGISRDSLLTSIAQAEFVWEQEAGKQLFKYEEGAPFKINLIFSEEQENLQKGNEIQNSLSSQERSLQNTKQQYDDAVERFDREQARYNQRLAHYQAEVDRWNEQGGAPQAEYQRLQNEFNALQREANDLNNQIDTINDLAQRSNSKIISYNEQADVYNNLFDGTPFDAGNTDGTEINIFSYGSRQELVTLLVHEFGHVLGIGHLEDESSVMHYLLNDENKGGVLSEEDKLALQESCRL